MEMSNSGQESDVLSFSLPDGNVLLAKTAVAMGYPSLEKAGPAGGKIADMAESALDLSRPVSIHKNLTIGQFSRGGIAECPDLFSASRIYREFFSQMLSPDRMIVFAVTLGGGIDAEIARLQREDRMFLAYALDAAGSVLVEEYAAQIETRLAEKWEEEGYRSTRRFSPGYCDWPVAEGQREIARLLDLRGIGINCEETGLMVPQKSVTAVMVGARGLSRRTPCHLCTDRSCAHRRAG